MVLITPQLKRKFRSLFRAARKEKIRVVWLEDDLVYVARRAKGHGKYLVKMIAVASISGGHQVRMLCREMNGNSCEGLQWKGFCVHMAAVCVRSEAKADKKQESPVAA